MTHKTNYIDIFSETLNPEGHFHRTINLTKLGQKWSLRQRLDFKSKINFHSRD